MTAKPFTRLIPREHGAWAMWLIPFAAGSVLAPQPNWHLATFFFGAFLLFVARAEFIRWGRMGFRLDFWLRHPETQFVSLLGTVGLAAAASAILPALSPVTAIYSTFLIVLLVSVVVLSLLRLERTVRGGLLGIFLLTGSGPIALMIGGQADLGLLLAFHMINFLFFSLSIFYVRAKVARLRESRNRLPLWVKARIGSLALTYLLLVHVVLWGMVQVGLVPAGMLLAFLPITLHTLVGLVRLDRPVSLRRLGFAEVAQSLVFLFCVLVFWV